MCKTVDFFKRLVHPIICMGETGHFLLTGNVSLGVHTHSLGYVWTGMATMCDWFCGRLRWKMWQDAGPFISQEMITIEECQWQSTSMQSIDSYHRDIKTKQNLLGLDIMLYTIHEQKLIHDNMQQILHITGNVRFVPRHVVLIVGAVLKVADDHSFHQLLW